MNGYAARNETTSGAMIAVLRPIDLRTYTRALCTSIMASAIGPMRAGSWVGSARGLYVSQPTTGTGCLSWLFLLAPVKGSGHARRFGAQFGVTHDQARKLGEAFAARRQRLGLSQNAVAAKAGLDSTVVLRLERGAKGGIQFTTVCRLAAALGLSLDRLATAAGLGTFGKPRARGRALTVRVRRLRSLATDLQSTLDHLSSDIED